jgi:hypothetical protein
MKILYFDTETTGADIKATRQLFKKLIERMDFRQ